MYSNSMHNNMMRRGNSTLKTVGIVVVALLFVYGLYSYHDLHTRHKRSEEKADRLRQQHDSLSAQLQVVYEQKSRLDKLLQQEKTDHKQSKDDLGSEKRRQEQKYLTEKQELLNRINSINSEHKMLQGQHEELEDTVSKLQDKLKKSEGDSKRLLEQYSQEYQQLKQEKDNEIATLKDQVANFERRNTDLQNKLHAAIQQNQISQNQVDAGQSNIAQLQEQLAQLQQTPSQRSLKPHRQNSDMLQRKVQKTSNYEEQPVKLPNLHVYGYHGKVHLRRRPDKGNLVANLPDQQHLAQQWQQQQQQQQQQNQQQQQVPQQQQVIQGQQQQVPQQQQVIQGQQQQQVPQQQQVMQGQQQVLPHQQGVQQQQVPQQQQQVLPQHIALQHKQQPQQQPQQQQQQQQQQAGEQQPIEQQQVMMQVAQPGENQKPYYDPKDAKPDHELPKDQKVGEVEDHNDNDNAINHQVAPPQPKVDENAAIVAPPADQHEADNKGDTDNAKKADSIADSKDTDAAVGLGKRSDVKREEGDAPKPVEVAPAGALGAQEAEGVVANDNVQAPVPKMAAQEPPNAKIEAPDGKFNVDKIDLEAGQVQKPADGLMLDALQPHKVADKDDEYYNNGKGHESDKNIDDVKDNDA